MPADPLAISGASRPSDLDRAAPGLELALTPTGTLSLRETTDVAPVEPAIAQRIRRAFDRGAGHGLLELGAALVDAALPPTLGFWRDLGRAFVAHLCGHADLEAARKRVRVPFPESEIAALAAGAPPMPGGEYLAIGALEALWEEMNDACRGELAVFDGSAEAYLQSRNAAWHLVGRVHFHLAENRADAEAPFAFLATYSTRLGAHGKPRHRPLGEAIREYAGAGNRSKLLALLEPVQRAAAKSPLLRELVDSGDVYRPLALPLDEAYRFLKEIPVFEESGVVVRVPDWWSARRPPRPQVQVTVGSRPPGGFGTDALLDFDVRVTLDGEALTQSEIAAVASSTAGLALIRGKWVEMDAARLREALEHWDKVKAGAERDGVGFIEGMRLLSGAALGDDAANVPPPETAEWSAVVAGPWLQEALDGLRGPDGIKDTPLPRALRAELRPYQEVGVRWLSLLHGLGLGACLADDMGLGKTLQVLALLLALKERAGASDAPTAALLVVPASLIANWRAEIERFAPSLRVLVAHPSVADKPVEEVGADDLASADLVITTYGMIHRLPWPRQTRWPLVVLDEAQAIKNPGTRQARAVKALVAQSRIALTGTPVENRLGDLWSLFDFLNPGLLGSARAFGAFAKQLGERPGGYAPLRELTRPYILRRLKTDRRIIADLPEKTELRAFCGLSKVQAALYQESVRSLAERLERVEAGIERRGLVLAYLMRFKQICNHPSQWLRDGAWAPEASGKLSRLRELAEVVADKQEKALVFTQFQEMADPLARFLATVFGRAGLVMHGGTPVRERRQLVERFQEDASVPFFVLSLKVGGTGLNLTAASHVIHFDRWWNPAVEDQATDRAFRIGQKRNVLVHKFVCRGTVEEKIDAMMSNKQRMAREVLEADGEAVLTELSDAELLRVVALDLKSALEAA
jgi:non-specific serine/threonine protein kinase